MKNHLGQWDEIKGKAGSGGRKCEMETVGVNLRIHLVFDDVADLIKIAVLETPEEFLHVARHLVEIYPCFRVCTFCVPSISKSSASYLELSYIGLAKGRARGIEIR